VTGVRCGLTVALLFGSALLWSADEAGAAKCATGRNHGAVQKLAGTRPALRLPAALRVPAPVATSANVYTTEHFRVLWGDGFDHNDPDWQVGNSGLPGWVETLAQALEEAYAAQAAMGFPAPYGSATYYLDAYVGNTGAVVDGNTISIGASYYAYTEIDRDYDVAYFVFNDDFSAYTANELDVLRATAAHELFHAVQRALGYPWDAESTRDGPDYISDARWNEEGWWLEASATWVEEMTFPEVNDYASYVQTFLAAPHTALNSMDGLREYGAAIFAGYLWQRHGGAGLIRSVFEDAYVTATGPERVEGALRGLLGTDLEDVVAEFWTHAADPSPSVWPDAALFKSATSPYWLATPGALPATLWPAAQERPKRFGANLMRVPAAELPAWFGMEWLNAGARWRVAVRGGESSEVELHTPGQAAPFWVGASAPGYTYVAVVNVASGALAEHYVIELGDDGLIDETVQWRQAGGGGAVTPDPVDPVDPVDPGDSTPVDSSEPSNLQHFLNEGGCFLRALGQ